MSDIEKSYEEKMEEYQEQLKILANSLFKIFQNGEDSKISSVSMHSDKYGYSNVSVSFQKAEVNEELQIVFGKAAVMDIVDDDGDVILNEKEFEKAIYDFMENYRKGQVNHKEGQVGTIVASWYDKVEKAWLVGYKVYDKEIWEDVKKGKYMGFSIGGKGIRKPIEGGE